MLMGTTTIYINLFYIVCYEDKRFYIKNMNLGSCFAIYSLNETI